MIYIHNRVYEAILDMLIAGTSILCTTRPSLDKMKQLFMSPLVYGTCGPIEPNYRPFTNIEPISFDIDSSRVKPYNVIDGKIQAVAQVTGESMQQAVSKCVLDFPTADIMQLTSIHAATSERKDSSGRTVFAKMNGYHKRSYIHNEIRIASMIKHDNVLSLYGVWIDPYSQYPVPVYEMGACDLFTFIHKTHKTPDTYNPIMIPLIALHISRGLDAMHNAEIVHRDIKSPNIIIIRTPTIPYSVTAKICDFDCACKYKKGDILDNVGTLRWKAPELIVPHIAVLCDRYAADVYSFGVVLYELITLSVPWAEYTTDESTTRAITTGDKGLMQSDALLIAASLLDIDYMFVKSYLNIMQHALKRDPSQRGTIRAHKDALEHSSSAWGSLPSMIRRNCTISSTPQDMMRELKAALPNQDAVTAAVGPLATQHAPTTASNIPVAPFKPPVIAQQHGIRIDAQPIIIDDNDTRNNNAHSKSSPLISNTAPIVLIEDDVTNPANSISLPERPSGLSDKQIAQPSPPPQPVSSQSSPSQAVSPRSPSLPQQAVSPQSPPPQPVLSQPPSLPPVPSQSPSLPPVLSQPPSQPQVPSQPSSPPQVLSQPPPPPNPLKSQPPPQSLLSPSTPNIECHIEYNSDSEKSLVIDENNAADEVSNHTAHNEIPTGVDIPDDIADGMNYVSFLLLSF